MVMEASPSPQSVGREFVRQYYTLLNKAPAHLHRFYNNYSSFVHGGLDAPNRETLPVIGQKQIHNRIQQLNFRDCHAKISQVDAQATLGNGVVVQVTGELSNGGAPMRRFTQTFVLAAQSPKKYYVHNDIFRYQDIVFSDEEGEGSGRSEGEEEEAGSAGAGGVGGSGAPYFPVPPPASAFPAAAFPAPPAPPLAPAAPPPHLNGHPAHAPLGALAPVAPIDDSTRHLVAALQAHSLSEPEPEPAASPPAPAHAPGAGPGVGPAGPPGPGAPEPVAAAAPEPEPAPEPEREPTPPPHPPAAPEPKTYANLLKSGSAAPPGARSSPPAGPAGAAPAPAAPHEARPRPPRAPHALPPPGNGGAALLGRAAAVPGQPAALRHGGGAARAVRALRRGGGAARAQQARRARRAAPPQLRLHHLRDVAGRARLPQRCAAVLPGRQRGRREAQRGGEEDARARGPAPPPAVVAAPLPGAPALPPLAAASRTTSYLV